MEADSYVRQVRHDVERMAEVARETDLDAPVPTCPGWSMRDLVRHLGGIHTWASTFVEQGRTSPIRETLEEQVGGWPADGELVDWFEEGGNRLARALSEADPGLAAWTFLPAESPRLHWARRQAHETAIHRVDAELAGGVVPREFETSFASDGVDELVCAFIARPTRGPRRSEPASLGLTSTDSGGSWTVAFDADSSTSSHGITGTPDAHVLAPAQDLYLWVWNRLVDREVVIDGDEAVARVWSETVHVRW